MSISVLEMRRAHNALQAFCLSRNTAPGASGLSLCCVQDDKGLLIGQVDSAGQDSGSRFRALVRLNYERGQWFLYWPQREGGWQPYPHLPQADTIQAVIEELEQAPLHVHWG